MKLPSVSVSTDLSQSLCFGCGQNNPMGLKLNFEWDGKTARAKFKASKHHQGWPGIIHGGILTCLLDEAIVYAAHFKGLDCLTAKMQVRFKRPVMVDELLVITSTIIKKARKLIEAKASISLPDGTLVAECTALQFVIEPPSDSITPKESNRG